MELIEPTYSKFDVYIYIPDISMSSIEVKYLSAIM